jgi:hypothetical protein
MRLGWAGRVEDDQEKASADGTRVIWGRVVIDLCVRGARLVDTSGGCDGSTGFTDAGSSFIDMFIDMLIGMFIDMFIDKGNQFAEFSLSTLNLSAVRVDLKNTVVL